MVSRMNIEERTIQFLKQHSVGVSKAVWPASVRRYVATGKGRRRIIILKHFLTLYRLLKACLTQKIGNVTIFCKGLIGRVKSVGSVQASLLPYTKDEDDPLD